MQVAVFPNMDEQRLLHELVRVGLFAAGKRGVQVVVFGIY